MAEYIKEFETWEEVIVNFFEYKVSKSELYKAREYISKKDKEIAKEKVPKRLKSLNKSREQKYQKLQDLRKSAPLTVIQDWINETSKKNVQQGNRTIKVSHAVKFIHSSANNAGIQLKEKSDDRYLSTASIKKNLIYDFSHKNGADITISRFLACQLSGNAIIDLILGDNFEFLAPFFPNGKVPSECINGFRNLVEEREIRSADKTKQLYFLVDNELKGENLLYHLLIPLYPSSLAEEFNNRINHTKYDKNQIEIHRQINSTKDKPKYHHETLIEFPHLAVQKFGGANIQNISMLNTSRSGKGVLFSAQPPTWQTQLKAPINQKIFFSKGFSIKAIKADIDYLRDFLLRFEHIELSIKDPKREKWINDWVNSVIDEFLFQVSTFYQLTAGWSNIEKIKLELEYQYLLDPHRSDTAFQVARKNNDWQSTVCQDFAHWLNKKLIGEDKLFTPQQAHTRMWADLLKDRLREFNQNIELGSLEGEGV